MPGSALSCQNLYTDIPHTKGVQLPVIIASIQLHIHSLRMFQANWRTSMQDVIVVSALEGIMAQPSVTNVYIHSFISFKICLNNHPKWQRNAKSWMASLNLVSLQRGLCCLVFHCECMEMQYFMCISIQLLTQVHAIHRCRQQKLCRHLNGKQQSSAIQRKLKRKVPCPRQEEHNFIKITDDQSY